MSYPVHCPGRSHGCRTTDLAVSGRSYPDRADRTLAAALRTYAAAREVRAETVTDRALSAMIAAARTVYSAETIAEVSRPDDDDPTTTLGAIPVPVLYSLAGCAEREGSRAAYIRAGFMPEVEA